MRSSWWYMKQLRVYDNADLILVTQVSRDKYKVMGANRLLAIRLCMELAL